MDNTTLMLRIPEYKIFRLSGFHKVFPVNLTLGVTYKCNSRCRTCNIWDKDAVDELTLEEYERIFKSIGKTLYWVTLSGGEPFLRKDLTGICRSLCSNCSPKIVNIPTNGISSSIPDAMEDILRICSNTRFIVNLSLDGVGEKHDEIRGVKGNFRKAIETYNSLMELKKRHRNLHVGIHTVISKFNVKDFPKICGYVTEELKPDSYVTEIAEERIELDNLNSGITPSAREYSHAIGFLMSKTTGASKLTEITHNLRREYYGMVKKTLSEDRQIIPCYAGVASCQITPDGEVWACCIKSESMGNLKDFGYDFGKIWRGKRADEIRKSIKKRKCFCTLANAAYTNILCNTHKFMRVGLRLLY